MYGGTINMSKIILIMLAKKNFHSKYLGWLNEILKQNI